jgi:phospholipase D1/2
MYEAAHHSLVQPETSNTDDASFNQVPPLRLTHFRSPQDTPSARTGPPRSLSYTYSLPSSGPSRGNSKFENGNIISASTADDAGFSPQSTFRGVLEHGTPEMDRKGKRRERTLDDHGDSWNLRRRWFHESPKEEAPGFEFGVSQKEDNFKSEKGEEVSFHHKSTTGEEAVSPTSRKSVLLRAFSLPHASQEPKQPGRAKWGRLRSLLPQIIQQDTSVTSGPSVVTSPSVNITDELITGGLSTLMLRLWFERDEKEHRRVPVLLHRLRIRVSDSIHPMQEQKSVFRIECEYANGAARWVVYRQLRDFLSLHAHYTVANVYNRHVQVDKMPEFPRTSTLFFKKVLS